MLNVALCIMILFCIYCLQVESRPYGIDCSSSICSLFSFMQIFLLLFDMDEISFSSWVNFYSLISAFNSLPLGSRLLTDGHMCVWSGAILVQLGLGLEVSIATLRWGTGLPSKSRVVPSVPMTAASSWFVTALYPMASELIAVADKPERLDRTWTVVKKKIAVN